jgi:hypothetical protein
MHYSGFEPSTFVESIGYVNHCTNKAVYPLVKLELGLYPRNEVELLDENVHVM